MAKKDKKAEKPVETPETKTDEKQEFTIQRIFLKDLSFETKAPDVFKKEWKPEMKMDLHTNTSQLEDGVHEVVLTITVTVTTNKEDAFVCEVKQAGIFNINGFPTQQVHHLLGSFCPNTLFPYAREVVSDIVTKGSFPQVNLSPINFDALYLQHLKQQQEKADTEKKTGTDQ